MSEKRYTEDHEWALDKGGVITVGITDYAQEQLGEVVYVELPEVGRAVDKGEEAAVVESVKAAGEVKSPLSGTVVEVNETLPDTPEAVNQDPEGEAWFYKLEPSNPEEFTKLMDEAAYREFVASLA